MIVLQREVILTAARARVWSCALVPDTSRGKRIEKCITRRQKIGIDSKEREMGSRKRKINKKQRKIIARFRDLHGRDKAYHLHTLDHEPDLDVVHQVILDNKRQFRGK